MHCTLEKNGPGFEPVGTEGSLCNVVKLDLNGTILDARQIVQYCDGANKIKSYNSTNAAKTS